jgi:hypothetical protein
VGMLGVTEKSFGHLSDRYDVAGGAIGGGSTGSSPAQTSLLCLMPPDLTHWLLLDRAVS